MNNYKYLILTLVVATFALAAAAACEKRTPVDPAKERLAVAGVVPMADAAFDDAGELLFACYSAGGNVYRIRESGLPNDCRSPMDVEFSWNGQGPAGPPGPQGPAGGLSGYEIVSEDFVVPMSTGKTLSVQCPQGKKALGGGWIGIHVASHGGEWVTTDGTMLAMNIYAMNTYDAEVTVQAICATVQS